MKNKILISLILISLVLSGCIGGEDKVLKANDNSTLTLYPNGQMTAHYTQFGTSYGGAYTMQKDTIVITLANGYSITLTPKGNNYVDQDGNIWTS